MFCGSFYEDKKSCIYKDSGEGDHQGGYGSNCEINGQTDCMDFYTCVKNINDRNEDRCLMDCVTSNDCYQGYECLRHSDNNYYCIPPSNKTTGELCNQFNGLECQNADDSCIKIADGYEKFCTKECELDIDCTNGTTCKEFNDKKYCMYNPTSNLGETCADNGNEQCKDDLICDFNYSRGPICTKECLSDLECSAYNSCSITYNNEKLCRPAINGLGDRTGELASECYEHGDSDCKEDFLCLSSSIDDKDAFCTKHCETNDECGENFHCANTTKTGSKLCVKGMVGELGSNCYNESCNQGLFCNFSQLNDYTATCTRTCDSIGEECSEKSGFYCNKIYDNFNLCLNQAPENIGNLGDKCPNGKCIEGLNCIYDIEGNFCSQPCDNEINICPENFACLQYDEIHNFCYLE
jgi:hypothetical protein